MTADIVERVLRSRRYHGVDPSLVERLVAEERVRSRNDDETVKRVKRRLHQAIGAFRGAGRSDALVKLRAAWTGSLAEPAFRAATTELLATHASTRERLSDLPAFFGPIWEITGLPARLLDLGCGLAPLTLPWMDLDSTTVYHAMDADRRPLDTVAAFLHLVGQPHVIECGDAVAAPPTAPADVALLLKLVTTLDRQRPGAAEALLGQLRVHHAVVSFTRRSLGGRGRGMEATYRRRMDRLVERVGRARDVQERSVASELVFVVSLDAHHG